MNKLDRYVNLLERRKLYIIIFWVIFTIVIGTLFTPNFIKSTNNDTNAPSDSQAAKAQKLIEQYFPNQINNENHIIMLEKISGKIKINDLKLFTDKILKEMDAYNGVNGINGYTILENSSLDFAKYQFLSKDGTVSIITISLKGDSQSQINLAQDLRALIQKNVPTGYKAYVTGLAELSLDTDKSIERDLETVDSIVIPLVLIALVILLRNWRYPILTIISIATTIIISFGILDILIQYLNVSIQSFVPSVLISLVLGIGVDYNLFLLTRFREERLNGKSLFDSIAIMLEHAGHTVFTSGMTLAIALIGLAFFPVTMLSGVGIAIGIGVIFLLIINLTVVPSLLFLFGLWIEPGKQKQQLIKSNKSISTESRGIFYNIGKFATKHNFMVIFVILLVTIPLSLQLAELQPKMESSLLSPIGSESAKGFEVLQNKFGSGAIGPVQLIIVQKNNDIWSNKTFSDVQSFIAQIIDKNDVNSTSIMSPMWLNGSAINSNTANAFINPLSPYYNTSEAFIYRQFINPLISPNGAFITSITLSVDPNSPKAMDILDSMISIATKTFDSNSYEFGFYGSTAGMSSIIDNVYNIFPYMILFVIIVIYIFIALMFKAVILPARLIATIALTLSFIYGATTVVFEYSTFLNNLFPVLNGVTVTFWMVPVMTFSIIIGLGIDYDIFTIERIKENVWNGHPNNEAISMGIGKTARIITGAGLIMMIAFGGMMFSSTYILIQFGFVLSFGVLLDTFIVRTLLVPALMSFADKYNWWPNSPKKSIAQEKFNKINKPVPDFQIGTSD